MADDIAFPVWLLPAPGGQQSALVKDQDSYQAALDMGYVLDTSTPVVGYDLGDAVSLVTDDAMVFPVWLLPPDVNGPLALINDQASYLAAVATGYLFDTVTPSVDHQTGDGTAPSVTIIADSASRSQSRGDGGGRNKRRKPED